VDSALEKKLLRPSEVAEICGVARNTIYRWLRRGVFIPVKIGGATYVKGDDLRVHLNGCPGVAQDLVDEERDELGSEAKAMFLSFRNHRRS
jgi:hypothetical protein